MPRKVDSECVSVTEGPYPVPGNWRWEKLGNITQIVGGGTPSTNNPDYYENGEIPWLSPSDLSNYKDMYITRGAKNITHLGLEKSSARLLPPGTVCLSTRAPIGYVVIAANSLSTNQGFKSFLPSAAYLPQYLFWYLKGNKGLLESRASGTTFLELSASKAASIEFPIAPLAEQRRIVERVERLFAKLDAAKEKAQSVIDGCEKRKAAILHKAFTGDLTAEWRKTHGYSLSDWQRHKFSDFCDVVRGGSPRPAGDVRFYDGPIPFLKVTDITHSDGPYIKCAEYSIKEAGLKKTRLVKANTLLLTNSGATLGVPGICTFETTFNDGIAAFLNLNPECLLFFYYFLMGKTQELRSINKGAAQPNLNTDIIGEIEIKLPTVEEQKEIARLIESVLNKNKSIKSAAESIINQIDSLKHSILARAFRGELGTNDPSELPTAL